MSVWHSLDVLQYYMADMVLTPSKWVGDHLKTVCKVPESRLRVLFNGTELPIIDDEGGEPVKTSPPEFVMLCTLEPHKGVNVFIEAAAHFLSIRPSGARFLVYGEGAPHYREVLEASIRRHNLQDHFILCLKQEVDSVYRRCCGVVVTAEFEPFSMVVIEGMSYAKPVIATRCGGPEEIIEDGKTGFLIAVGDSQALAERMLRLVDNPTLRREIGFAGRLRAESVYDIKLIARQYLDVILSVVDGGHASAATERKRFLEALLDADLISVRPGEAKPAAKEEIRTPISVPTGDALLPATDTIMTLERLRLRLREIKASLNDNTNNTVR
jgi:glycosyltransferase involved in cell wall biosynthesis